jgi:arylsulfatase A-like enzyme
MKSAIRTWVERHLPALSVAWVVLAAASLAMSLVAPRGLLGDGLLPGWARVTLACAELAGLALAILLAGGLFAALGRLNETPRRRILARVLRGALVGALLLAYAGSWSLFWFSGQFLGRDGIEFLATNGLTLVRDCARMYGVLLFVLPPAVVLLAVAVSEGLPRWVARWRSGRRRLFARGAAVAAALCALGALGGEVVHAGVPWSASDPATGMSLSLPELYRNRREYRAGPFTHALSDLVVRREGPPAGVAGTRFISPPRVAMEDFLRGADPESLRRWNVVVVLVDSLRADQVEAGGGAREVLPALNALAREGRAYTDALSVATHTDYAAPAAISGQHPLRDPVVHRYPRDPSYPRVMIHDILKPLGWRTAVFSSQDERWGQMMHFLDTGRVDRFFHAATSGGTKDATPRDGILDDSVTVTEAMKWIDAGGAEPFFVYLNLQNAHSPYALPPGAPRRFGPANPDFTISYGWFPRERVAEVKGIYADSLAYVDAQLGRLFDRLRDRGMWDRTVVVVSADHGEGFYEHGYAAHGSMLYDESLRVPIVVRAHGLEPSVDARPAQLIDIPPTVLGLLGLPPHPAFQGIDLAARRFDPDRSRFAIVQTPAALQYAVVRSGRKLIYDERLRRHALYDLVADPAESVDLSSARSAEARDLLCDLSSWYHAQLGYYADPVRQALEYPPVPAGR